MRDEEELWLYVLYSCYSVRLGGKNGGKIGAQSVLFTLSHCESVTDCVG